MHLALLSHNCDRQIKTNKTSLLMASSSSSSSSPQVLNEINQDQEHAQEQQQPVQECLHRTKAVQFLGRTIPIILQNDNGPCPLLAICNILLLRNNLKLSPDIAVVSQEKLLALVAEKLIDSNSNVNNKDADYVQNQQQNIADAIDLLPRLATGIDVNLKFRRIDDFEFTRECAIFDLLDIPLYHGWIVDPQDYDTANALGSKSYNALMGELVALETQNEGQHKHTLEGDSVDFVAATTATLGVPSPNLSKSRSFGDSPRSVSDNQTQRKGDLEEEAESLRALKQSEAGSISDNQTQRKVDLEEEAELLRALKLSEAGSISDNKTQRKGDLEEEAELLRALKLSEADSPLKSDPVVGHVDGETMFASLDEKKCNKEVIAVETNDLHKPEPSLPDDCTGSGKNSNEQRSSAYTLGEAVKLSLKTDVVKDLDQSTCMRSEESMDHNDVNERNSFDTLVQNESSGLLSPIEDSVLLHGSHAHVLGGDEKVHNQSNTISDHEASEEPHGSNATISSCLSETHRNTNLSNGQIQQTDASKALASAVEGSEPIYEGEECVLGARSENFVNCEPVYEGEVVLAEQADKSTSADTDLGIKNEITPQQGELIRSFLRSNASQLTLYGLFCLQDGLKERELCVFFRNNHFSTMFKFKGELYLLATDQGFIGQPDLVWEKLNEVNGDTLFVTGNFNEFVVESRENNTWNEHNALNSTAEYLANLDAGHINSDLQLAIALQQEEFDQQPLRHNPQQISSGNISRLVTGPQVAGNTGRLSPSSSSPKDEGKSKERCIVM